MYHPVRGGNSRFKRHSHISLWLAAVRRLMSGSIRASRPASLVRRYRAPQRDNTYRRSGRIASSVRSKTGCRAVQPSNRTAIRLPLFTTIAGIRIRWLMDVLDPMRNTRCCSTWRFASFFESAVSSSAIGHKANQAFRAPNKTPLQSGEGVCFAGR